MGALAPESLPANFPRSGRSDISFQTVSGGRNERSRQMRRVLFIFDDHRFDVLALGTLKRALIVPWLIQFDAREHHCGLAFRTLGPFPGSGSRWTELLSLACVALLV